MKDKTMLKEIQIQYEKCLEEQKVENENKANLALLREQELIKQSKLIFEEKITKYLKAVESFKLELENKDIEFYSEYFNQENQYPIFRFMIKIPPVSNKSNKLNLKYIIGIITKKFLTFLFKNYGIKLI